MAKSNTSWISLNQEIIYIKMNNKGKYIVKTHWKFKIQWATCAITLTEQYTHYKCLEYININQAWWNAISLIPVGGINSKI